MNGRLSGILHNFPNFIWFCAHPCRNVVELCWLADTAVTGVCLGQCLEETFGQEQVFFAHTHKRFFRMLGKGVFHRVDFFVMPDIDKAIAIFFPRPTRCAWAHAVKPVNHHGYCCFRSAGGLTGVV